MLRAVFVILLFWSASSIGADQRPVLSLVVDDLGYSFQHGRAAIELKGDHTYAIIPGTSYGKKLARLADIHKKEVILHLPLQAINSGAAAEPNALNETMDEDQLNNNLVSMLREISMIKGVNNHMGSHLTQIDYFMRPIMDGIKAYNPEFYFLDSRTSPNSIAHTEALNAGLTAIRRDVFLDNDQNPESIHLQYQIWLQKSRDQGHAVAIGHPHPNTIDYLTKHILQDARKFRFLSVSKLINKKLSDSQTGTSYQTSVSLVNE